MMAASDFSTSTDKSILTFKDLHLALTRCMESHPPCGLEFQMHPDANVIPGLWAQMNYEQAVSVPVDQVKPEVLDAYRRWILSPS